LGLLAKDEVVYETAISTSSDKISGNKREIETKEVLLNHVGVHETIREDYDYYKTVQVKMWTEELEKINK